MAFRRTPQRGFFDVYLPVLILLPDYYRWVAPGMPDPTFSMAAILPVGIAWMIQGPRNWRFSLTDLLVFAHAFCVACSEFLNAGYDHAQNLMFEMICWVILPYALAKSMIEPCGQRVEFGRRLVWLLFLVSIISIYEFKMGATPWRMVLDPFFPGHADGWVTTFRWGFARVAGPYGHAILAGIILVVAFRLQRWLEGAGAWEPRFRRFHPFGPASKAQVISLGLLAGVVMTMVRGPWIGAALAAFVTSIGNRREKWRAVWLTLAALAVIGVPVLLMAWSYVSVGRVNATSVSQESAAYRKELIDKYVDIALERSLWGWGRNAWPRVDGMPSIDNHFLLLILMHGAGALGFLLAIFAWMMARLFWAGMKEPPVEAPGSSFSFALLGVFVAVFFSIATVYMGNQVVPVFFLITGWAEGYLLWGTEVGGRGERRPAAAAVPYRFQRVLR
ncbi:MAG: O-antigen ligase family protein [Blastocatellia bacterium]|nr:O-antigen ligase family protein [Blastocatellia bacterium]